MGIGFALPSALAEPIIKQIREYGKAKRAWLGVKIQEVSEEIAESLAMKNTDGALVLQVIEGSPSAEAGVQEGDVILKFNNQEISQMRKLPRIVADSPIGEMVVIQVLRNGEVKNLRITLGEMKEQIKAVEKDDEKPITSGGIKRR